ncbi:MAG: tetratricopeptide repeat protein [Chloroflexi bacterium]|nr:tetratricopeptide repeat protein [Chloroflexota bacterium]
MQADQLSAQIGNRYQLEEQLGRGGMGAVYRAYDRLSGESVALKRVMTSTTNLQFASRQSNDSAASTSGVLRIALAQEFHTLASLHHPNIIRVLDYGFDDERLPYLTMDLLRAPRTLLQAGENAPLETKINLLVQMLQALAYLHRRSVIHRDLKPDNVAVVRENGANRVRVLDFGLALTPEYLNAGGGSDAAGTLAYMAPEVLQGDYATEASDLYAVGVIAYEMLVGVHPFASGNNIEMIKKVLKTEPDLSALLNVLPLPEVGEIVIDFSGAPPRRTLTEIVARLLAKHPIDRYRDASTVITELCAAVDIPIPQESDAIRESFLQAARFVGREAELRQLRGAMADAIDGKGSLWLIGGESGVGKSRLIEELRTRALIEGVLTLRGQTVSSGGLPYGLWRDPLRRLILSAQISPDEASVLSTILPDIHALFDDVPPFTGGDSAQRLSRVIIDLFRRQTKPIVLLFEDLQWATESLEVLKRLAAFVADLPLLIVGSFRDDERPRLPEDLPQARVLSLHRLAAEEIARLTGSMLGSARTNQDLVEFLQRETEGNAFFLVETVRALAEEAGSLSAVGHETLPARLFTGGMQQVVWRRINRVPGSAHGLLKLAAVIGRDLDLALLRHVLAFSVNASLHPNDLDLEDWLTTCANRAVFEAYEGGWRFAHDKLREALLDALKPDESQAYHREAAAAIEAVYASTLDRYALALVGHWRAAGDHEKESHYLLIAGYQAYEQGMYPHMRDLYARALEIRAFEFEADPVESQSWIRYQLGHALHNMGEYDAAREHYQAGLTLAESVGDRKGIADNISGLGEADMRQGLLDEAEAKFKQSQAIRMELGVAREIAYDYMNLGVIEAERSHFQNAHELFKLCLEWMRKGGTERDLSRAFNNYGLILDMLGDKTQARQYHQQALEIRERLHDVQGMAYSTGNLATLELDLENYGEARSLFEKSLRLARQIGERFAIAAYLVSLGDVSFKLHDYDAALSYFQQSLDIRREIQDRRGIILSTLRLGDVARETQRYTDALALCQQALTFCAEYHLDADVLAGIQAVAELLMAQNRPRPALKLLAFVRAHRDYEDPKDQSLIDKLEATLPPSAFASALELGAALVREDILAKIGAGELDF